MSSEAKATQAALVKHKCPDCGFTAPSQSKLTVHHRVHSGERPFACLSCDSTFVSKGHRDRHARRVHLKSDPIPCSFSGCDKTFSCVDSMRRHIAAVHLKTRFACPIAGCTFTSGWKDHIKPHVRAVHEKEKPFACSVAGCSFRSV